MTAALTLAWTQQEAIALCTAIEKVCPKRGFHVALTGGTLYKTGPRKDCDILFYRIRQVEAPDTEGLWEDLRELGVVECSGFGWCYKCTYHDKSLDIFFPEAGNSGDYVDDATFIQS